MRVMNYGGIPIQVIPEHGHWCLKHGNNEQRCDVGELNEALPSFAHELLREQNRLQQSVSM